MICVFFVPMNTVDQKQNLDSHLSMLLFLNSRLFLMQDFQTRRCLYISNQPSAPRTKDLQERKDRYLNGPSHLKLAALNLLASCSPSKDVLCSRGPESGEKKKGRLEGRSPLSCKIASKVAHPVVLSSWNPSAMSCVQAMRHRRASSSWN